MSCTGGKKIKLLLVDFTSSQGKIHILFAHLKILAECHHYRDLFWPFEDTTPIVHLSLLLYFPATILSSSSFHQYLHHSFATVMNYMNKEILRDLWNGKLPLRFSLHSDDVDGMHEPDPYFMMVSRVTYFPLVIDKVVKYFYRFINQSKQSTNDLWIDYDGQPIRWHHPIGLSWDLFGNPNDLPWKLILHFQDFPIEELIRCNNKAAVESHFMSTIKEADALKHKSQIMGSMQKKEHNQLWSSLSNDKYEQFWAINKKLMEKTNNEPFRYIPFRLYFPDSTFVQKVIKPCTNEKESLILRSQLTTQDIIKETPITYKCSHQYVNDQLADNSTHRPTTMLDLIKLCFSDRIDDLIDTSVLKSDQFKERPNLHRKADELGLGKKADSNDNLNNKQVEKSASQTSDSDNTDKEVSSSEVVSEQEIIDIKSLKYRFILHGTEIDFNTPLQWLSEHMSYPDNFLHICAVNKEYDSL